MQIGFLAGRDCKVRAVIALAVLQLLDWIRDAGRREDGEQVSPRDAVRELMVAPYERIIVMHFAIILSALALSKLGEPVVGLVVFVAVKTAFDIRHWREDEERAKRSPAGEVRGRSRLEGGRTHDSPPQWLERNGWSSSQGVCGGEHVTGMDPS